MYNSHWEGKTTEYLEKCTWMAYDHANRRIRKQKDPVYVTEGNEKTMHYVYNVMVSPAGRQLFIMNHQSEAWFGNGLVFNNTREYESNKQTIWKLDGTWS